MMGLCFIGPFSFAQDAANNPNQNPSQIEEEHDTKNLDKLLKDYNKDQAKVLKDAATINKMDDTGELSEKELGSGKVVNPDDENALVKANDEMLDPIKFKKKAAPPIDPKELNKLSPSAALRVALGPLQKMSEAELLNLLRENSKDSPAVEYINHYPKLALFAVRLIKDAEALPALLKILDDQKKLIRFGGLMLFTIVFAFILRRLLKKEGRSVLMALSLWLLRFLIITSLRFGIIVYFYGKEIEPTFNLVTKTFF